MTEALLPRQFAELEPFAAKWCLRTETERFAQRMASSMEEIQAFYDAFFPRAEEAIAYCDAFPLDDMPDDAQRLHAPPVLARHGVVPGRGVASAAHPRLRRRVPRPPHRARSVSPGPAQILRRGPRGPVAATLRDRAPEVVAA